MSKYTTEVRFICENEAGLTESKGFNDVNSIITSAAPDVFNFDFPIFDEAYRIPLEIKILRHYYTREICEETVGLWKLRLQDRLNIIMPYYNQLYRSELLEFNPFYDVNLTREHTRENEGNETRTNTESKDRTEVINTDTTSTNTNVGKATGATTTMENGTTHEEDARWDLYSDTPQGGIDVITNDGDGVIGNTYLTNARRITDTKDGRNTASGSVNNTNSSTITDEGVGSVDTTITDNEQTSGNGTTALTSTEDYIEHITGKQGALSYSKMLEEFRETFLNIDKMIIEELSDLFFGLWA